MSKYGVRWMGRLLRFNIHYYLRLRQTMLALALVVIFAIAFYFVMPVQQIGNMPATNAQNGNQIHAALDQYNQRIIQNKKEKAAFHLYTNQEQLVGKLIYMDKFDISGVEYNQASRDLARAQLATRNHADADIVSIAMPAKVTLQREVKLSQTLMNDKIDRDKFARTGMGYLGYILQYLGMGLFAIFMLVVVELPSRRGSHFMIEGNYPITAGKQRVNAIAVVFMLTFVTVAIALAGGVGVASLHGGVGNLAYPQVLWLKNAFVATTMWGYLAHWFGLLFLVFIVVTLLNYLISYFTQYELLSMIIQGLLWGLTYALPSAISQFIPTSYYNVTAVLDGSNGANYWQAVTVLFTAIVGLSGLLMIITQRGSQND